jgi:SAM-dependent methyltransferase
MPEPRDRWTAGSSYENFMGRWSQRLAARFVAWLGVPPRAHWLDVGCGTGSLARAILAGADPASVVGCDPAAPFIEFARDNTHDARASFVTAGVGSVPARSGGYDSVATLLALNFFPNAEAGVRELRSLAAPGGTVSACVWDYRDGMEFLRRFWDVAVAIDPSARQLDEGIRFPICRPDALTSLFDRSGLRDVRCEAIEIPTEFRSFDDYWRPLLGTTGPAPSYVASLDDDRRATLAKTLRETLRPRPDGVIALTARAWAVRGTS